MEAHIVVLDNNEVDRKILRDLLTSHNYRVSCPRLDGNLLQQIKDAEADAIMTEHQAGQRDAVELIRQLRRDPILEGVPVIVFTTADQIETQLESLKAGADLYLTKPCDEDELLAKLDAQLRLRRLQSELQAQLTINQKLIAQMRDDMELGKQVQQSFLPPRHLRTENFRVSSRLEASGALSGDYFDYKLITPDRLAIFLADVSGHGIASALLASRLKAFFDENFRRANRPRMFMEQLNRVIIDLGEHYHIATAVCLHIDVMEATLSFANAGHRTVYLLDAESGKYAELPANGPALGMFEEFEMAEANRGFMPSRNRLVAFTDGLVEFRRPDGQWATEETFRDGHILPQARLPLDEYVTHLLESSRALTGVGRWDDDVSLLAVDF